MCEGTAHSTSDQSALDAALGIADAASGSTGAASGSKSDAHCHASPALSHVAWMDDKRLGEDSGDEGGKKLSVHPSWLLQNERDKEPGCGEEIACDQDSMDEEDEAGSIRSALVGLCDELGSEGVAKWTWKTLKRTLERRLNMGEGDLDEWKSLMQEWYERWTEGEEIAKGKDGKKAEEVKGKWCKNSQQTTRGQVANSGKLLRAAENERGKEQHDESGQGSATKSHKQQSKISAAMGSSHVSGVGCSALEARESGKEMLEFAQAEASVPGAVADELVGGSEMLEVARPAATSAPDSIAKAGTDSAPSSDRGAHETSVTDTRDARMPATTGAEQQEGAQENEDSGEASGGASSRFLLGFTGAASFADLGKSSIATSKSNGIENEARIEGQQDARAKEGPGTECAHRVGSEARTSARTLTPTHMRVSARKSIGEGINPPCFGAEEALDSSAPSSTKASVATALLRELAQERERRKAFSTVEAQPTAPADESLNKGSKAKESEVVEQGEVVEQSSKVTAAIPALRITSSAGDSIGDTSIRMEAGDEEANDASGEQADQGKEGSSKDGQQHEGVGAATQLSSTSAPQSAVKKSRKLKVKVRFRARVFACVKTRTGTSTRGSFMKRREASRRVVRNCRRTLSFIPLCLKNGKQWLSAQ